MTYPAGGADGADANEGAVGVSITTSPALCAFRREHFENRMRNIIKPVQFPFDLD